MKSLKCNVINIWGSNWVPSNVLSLCKIWRVRLSSFSSGESVSLAQLQDGPTGPRRRAGSKLSEENGMPIA